MPGALLLSGVAALRAGAGKLQMATVCDASIALGLAVPESLVVALPVDDNGEIDGEASLPLLKSYVTNTDVILVGPGMMRADAARKLLITINALAPASATIVLDGVAVIAIRGEAASRQSPEPVQTFAKHDEGGDQLDFSTRAGKLILTPHAGETAALMGVDKKSVIENPVEIARRAAADCGGVVALKGEQTFIADRDGRCVRFSRGCSGLGTSGSGDTLAGITAGLAARGADPFTATIWSVWAHGTAGRKLARRIAPVGFLARELLAEIPALVGNR